MLNPASTSPESLLPTPRHVTYSIPSSSVARTSRNSLEAFPAATVPSSAAAGPSSPPLNAPTPSPAYSPTVLGPTAPPFQDGPAPSANASAPSPNPAGMNLLTLCVFGVSLLSFAAGGAIRFHLLTMLVCIF